MRRPAFLAALLSLAASTRLTAQSTTAAAIGLGGIDNLLGRVESINIYYGGNADRRGDEPGDSPRLGWAKDYGLEFLVHLSEFGPPTGRNAAATSSGHGGARARSTHCASCARRGWTLRAR